MCQTDTAQPRTRGCSEHSPGNKALSCMRPILHPRAACVVGHWAKDELTGARGCRQARAMASMAPIAVGPVQTVVLTRPRPNGSMMSGRALHRRSNPTRWASGSGRGGERFARKRQSVREALDVLGRSAFRRPCAAGPAIPMATRGSRAPAIPDECLPRKRVARADRPGRAQRRRRSYVPTTASRGSSWPIPAVLGWAVGSCSASRTSSYVERRRITDGNRRGCCINKRRCRRHTTSRSAPRELWRFSWHVRSSIAKVRPPATGRASVFGNGSQPVFGGSALCDTLRPEHQ